MRLPNAPVVELAETVPTIKSEGVGAQLVRIWLTLIVVDWMTPVWKLKLGVGSGAPAATRNTVDVTVPCCEL